MKKAINAVHSLVSNAHTRHCERFAKTRRPPRRQQLSLPSVEVPMSATNTNGFDSDDISAIAYVLLYRTPPCTVLTCEMEGNKHLPTFYYSNDRPYRPDSCCPLERNIFRSVAELLPREIINSTSITSNEWAASCFLTCCYLKTISLLSIISRRR